MSTNRVIHAFANCQDCEFCADDYHTALRKGREHARQTGHRVDVEQCRIFKYNSTGNEGAS